MRFATTVIHAGQEPDPRTGAVTLPIYMTSTYSRKEQDEYAYARGANPICVFAVSFIALAAWARQLHLLDSSAVWRVRKKLHCVG